jgi:hypothetical protein
MTKEQVETILGHPLAKLKPVCEDEDGLLTVLSLAIGEGEARGRRLAFEERSAAMLADYSQLSITN